MSAPVHTKNLDRIKSREVSDQEESFLNTLDPVGGTVAAWPKPGYCGRELMDVEIIQVASDYGCPCHYHP